ncbi:MAG: putative toxin-antitoxin system toxin component, PIN family [Tyzzerella sp.]|nr:putative toxin-antitoxin system toxin component, PIN family [Tyzzerella sp.]
MKCYVVVDTNVLVSALLSHQHDSATVQLLDRLTEGGFVPVYSDKIMQEYWTVLKREKFGFAQERIRHVLEAIIKFGASVDPTPTGVELPDMKDLPFYEVVMEKRVDDAYLVTGNLKHFPRRTYIVTARQMLDILDEKESLS